MDKVNSSTPTNVTPARAAFDLRMLLHVTENGTPRMLKEVIHLWQESTRAPGIATNPFKHKYHPDHDNLNATFTGPKEEAYQVTRTIEMTFTATDPGSGAGATALEYGSSILGGTYRETLSDLHRRPLVGTGTFRISRVSNSPVLNQ